MFDRNFWLKALALGAVALATQLMVWLAQPKPDAATFVGPPRSDYTLTDFQLNALDAAGQLAFTISGPRLARRAGDGSIAIATPQFVLIDGNGSAWNGNSASAWVNKDGSEMKLEGAVRMHRDATALIGVADIVTSDLTTWPKAKRMETAAPVTLTEPGSILEGTGMKADLATHNLELLADVHAILQPKKSR